MQILSHGAEKNYLNKRDYICREVSSVYEYIGTEQSLFMENRNKKETKMEKAPL
jgi:hypothetical protein